MKMKSRRSGVLLHVSSLPGPFGIGDLGPSAYEFVDFLAKSGQSLWSVLPINDVLPHEDSCPYCPGSAFAGNPLLISPEALMEKGLLDARDLREYPKLANEMVDIPSVIQNKTILLKKAFAKFSKDPVDADKWGFLKFKEGTEWLPDYVEYVCRRSIGMDVYGCGLTSDGNVSRQGTGQINGDFVSFTQFIFFEQWKALKKYANARGVFLAGDISFYVSVDSSDVRANPGLFGIDVNTGKMTVESGAPPDEFQPKGQFWRTPIYNWRAHAEDGFRWWRMRIAENAALYDTFRLDHFRGFEAFWSIPSGSKTPKDGHFVKGPAKAFFEAISDVARDAQMFVEDLGLITKDVHDLREALGLPGMNVLQLAFSSKEDHPYLPYKCIPNCVMYTSTHDLPPMVGWFNELDDRRKSEVENYIGAQLSSKNIHWAFVRLALSSVANWVLIPAQDLLGLGNEARMNIPGMRSENHCLWRVSNINALDAASERLFKLTQRYGRLLQSS